ncbi:hypothetical protein EGW08_003677 [Elysia chlorotica]|uniref:Uncharacterized protein n=1 Tax=Elysia chlorotica TaxID=188477 RepID=A0A433U421_ELYCH|nr:hypothetical protein EGW08_003677 [Elysia chlorotica]
MYGAISKLREEIWKNEGADEQEEEKETKPVNNVDGESASQSLDTKQKAGAIKEIIEGQVVRTKGKEVIVLQTPSVRKMRQTEVSRIRGSTFHSPEEGDAQALESLQIHDKDPADTDKTIEKPEQNGEPVPAGSSKLEDQSETSDKNARSKALARRQKSENEIRTEGEEEEEAVSQVPEEAEKKELSRMKGMFYCEKCQKRWTSLHVYCEPGTKKVER